MKLQFDAEKAVEAIIYIVNNVPKADLHSISKVLYFADQKHVVDYGRFITSDTYVAMRNGPVPSLTYNILKFVRGDERVCRADHAKAHLVVKNKYEVLTKREANLEEFSDSDIECLDYSIARYGSLSFDELTKVSHDAIYDTACQDDYIPPESFSSLAEIPKNLEEHMMSPAC